MNIYTYQGRLLASPRWGSMRPETLSKNEISLGTDSFAVIDQNELKCNYFINLYFKNISVNNNVINFN